MNAEQKLLCFFYVKPQKLKLLSKLQAEYPLWNGIFHKEIVGMSTHRILMSVMTAEKTEATAKTKANHDNLIAEKSRQCSVLSNSDKLLSELTLQIQKMMSTA